MTMTLDDVSRLTTAPTLSREEGQSIILNNQIKIKVLRKESDGTVILQIVRPNGVSVKGENLKVGRVNKNRFKAEYDIPLTIRDENTGKIIAVITPVEESRNRIRIQTKADKSLIVHREEVSGAALRDGIEEHEIFNKGYDLHRLLRLQPWQDKLII